MCVWAISVFFSPSQSLVCFSSTQGCPWQRQHHLCCYWNIPCIRVQRYSRIWLSALIFWPQYVLSLFLTPLTRSQWAMSRREKSKRNAKNKCFGAQLVLERDSRCDLYPTLPHMDHCRWYHGSLQGTTERRFIGSIKKAVNVFGYSCRICSLRDKLYLMIYTLSLMYIFHNQLCMTTPSTWKIKAISHYLAPRAGLDKEDHISPNRLYLHQSIVSYKKYHYATK